MLEQMRWAARYTFADALWRGRPRIVLDPRLEHLLVGDPGRSGEASLLDAHPTLAALVDDLLPRRPDELEVVWMVVESARVAAALGPTRPGTTFVAREGLPGVLRRAAWDVALLDLGAEDPDEALLRALAGVRGRSVVLSAAAGDSFHDGALGYHELASILSERLGGGRIYGMYLPGMAAVVEYGEPIETGAYDGASLAEVDESEDEDADRGSSSDGDDVPLTFDNTLGSQDPHLVELIAVSGPFAFEQLVAEGLALIELPVSASLDDEEEVVDDEEIDEVDDAFVEPDEGEGIAQVRAELALARRQADMAAIERQRHLERMNALEVENAELRRTVEELRDRLARAVAGDSGGDGRPDASPGSPELEVAAPSESRLDAALAREQSLRWRVAQLERELEQVMGRPVSELEAEVARLRASAATVRGSVDSTRASGELEARPAADAEGIPRGAHGRNGHTRIVLQVGERPPPDPATEAVLRTVDGLVRRLERGGIKTLELRRELVALRRRLRC